MKEHISEQYDVELSHIRGQLMAMGGLVERQVANACIALIEAERTKADEVRDAEAGLNQLEIELDDRCVAIIARRQPAARDLRQIVSVMKVITDLERIGDESERIAIMALKLADSPAPVHQYTAFRHMQDDVAQALSRALDAFARLDVENALRVMRADEDIDAAYHALVRQCTSDMRSSPDSVESLMNVLWAARSLERIGDHAKNISEYVIYQVKGLDVRHSVDVLDSI